MHQLTAIILTYNEEPNIERTLSALKSVPQVLVIDSFSSDKTKEITESFSNVKFIQHEFLDHTSQWEFARNQVKTEWTLALDCDYQFSVKGLIEIQTLINTNPEQNGFFANFLYAIDGEVIQSGIYPPVCVLYRTLSAWYEKDGHTQRLQVKGSVGQLVEKVIHDDRKSFKHWMNSQLNYAKLEAEKLTVEYKVDSRNDKIRLKTKFTPILVFFYCIFVNRGWKDGKAGWKYAFQRMIAEIILQYYLLDLKR